MKEPVLSIIVPVYNVKDCLKKCVQSILEQSFEDYELILVDDGSTDGSGQICDSFVDERIRSLHQKNGGQSSARNSGLRICRGQYIMFCDSDDWYEDSNTFKHNIQILENHPEVDVLQFPAYSLTNGIKKPHFVSDTDRVVTGDEVFKEWYRGKDTLSYECWNKIYRRHTIDGLFFIEGKVAEDIIFHENLLSRVKSVYISTKGQYIYYTRQESTTHDSKKMEKLMLDALDGMSLFYQDATHYPDQRIRRMYLLMRQLIVYMELKAKYPNHDFSCVQSRLFCYRLRLTDVIGYMKDKEAPKRLKRHAWALFFLGRCYEHFYVTLLRLTLRMRPEK